MQHESQQLKINRISKGAPDISPPASIPKYFLELRKIELSKIHMFSDSTGTSTQCNAMEQNIVR